MAVVLYTSGTNGTPAQAAANSATGSSGWFSPAYTERRTCTQRRRPAQGQRTEVGPAHPPVGRTQQYSVGEPGLDHFDHR